MIQMLSLVPYQFLPAKTGGQKCIALGTQYLANHINITCVSVNSNEESNSEEYELIKLFSNSKLRYMNPFYFFSLKKIIRKKEITHLYIEHPYLGWLALVLKWFCGIKLIIRSHNIESIRFKTVGKWWWKVLWYYEKFVHQKADLNLFITQEDLIYAKDNFKLVAEKCAVMTYGFELNQIPDQSLRTIAKEKIRLKYSIADKETIILFNGTLDYRPNIDALDKILENINPLLLTYDDFKYKIIICGKNLPIAYNGLINYKLKNILYVGFVDNIDDYYLASDIFINPVIDGGGIKTKIVEALGYNLSLVTTKSGSIGISKEMTQDKMLIINDEDWESFAKAIKQIDTNCITPKDYFNHFYWGNISKKTEKKILSI